jgi:uncharacterized protein
LFNKLIPSQQVRTIFDIDLDKLWHSGIRGIITDLDNTLVGAKDPHPTSELTEWLKQVKEKGFKAVIVSNNGESRVSTFAGPISIPFISGAKKPTNRAFRKAMDMMRTTAAQTVVIGDQLLTDVLGGNRMGLFTILVDPISLRDEGIFTKVNRKIEKIVRRWTADTK